MVWEGRSCEASPYPDPLPVSEKLPMILDQPEIALRVSTAGADLRLINWAARRRGCWPPSKRVLSDPVFRDKSRRLARDFAQFSGGGAASRLIENLVALPDHRLS